MVCCCSSSSPPLLLWFFRLRGWFGDPTINIWNEKYHQIYFWQSTHIFWVYIACMSAANQIYWDRLSNPQCRWYQTLLYRFWLRYPSNCMSANHHRNLHPQRNQRMARDQWITLCYSQVIHLALLIEHIQLGI